MNKIEEFERDLKVAYLNYENTDLKETLKYLDRILETILKDDKSLERDPFWKTLTCDVFKAIVLNSFYNKMELTGNDLDSLLEGEEKLKENIKEFCNNFRKNELINFISHIENIADKPLKDVKKILMSNIEKMNITSTNSETNNNEDTISDGLTDNDIDNCYKTIYSEVFPQEDYELCMNYLNVLYRPIFLVINPIDKDNILKEIILTENENYQKNKEYFKEEIKEYQNPTPENIFSFYCGLSYRLADLRIKEKKEYILLAKYCKIVFDIILNDGNFKEVCENRKRSISETLVDFSFASGNNAMSFRIHDIYGNPFIDREVIMEKIKYLSESGDKRKNYNNINDFIIHEINIIKDILENNLAYNIKYVPCLRAEHCIQEFDLHFESNQFEQCFYNIYEVIESDKNQAYRNLVERSSDYEYSKLISIEEKNIVLGMINKLIDKLK